MARTYYKVVKRQYCPDCLVSAVADRTLSVKYRQGRVTKPKLGRLFVFVSFEDAKIFIHGSGSGYEIWTCEVTKPTKIKWIESWWSSSARIEEFWKKRNGREIAPEGTFVVDSVKLLEKVYKT